MPIMTINGTLNPIEDGIKDTIAKIRQENLNKHQLDQEKILDFYQNNQNTTEYLGKFGFDKQQEFPLSTVNITKKIIDKISLVYKTPPDRYLVKADGSRRSEEDEYQDFLTKHPQIDRGIQVAEKMKNALSQILFRPYWYNEKWHPWIETEWVPVFGEGDPLTPIGYIIPLKRDVTTTDKGKIKNKNTYMYWSKDEYYWFDENSNTPYPDPELVKSKNDTSMTNPLKRLPFVEMRKDIPIQYYWDIGAIDLVSMNQQINVLINDLNRSIRAQSYDQPYAKGVSSKDASEIKIDPFQIITLESETADLALLSYNPKIADVIQAIKDLINIIGWTYNVHINWSMEGSPASGFSLLVQNIDLLEARENDVMMCKMYEKEIYEVIQAQTEYLKTDVKKALPRLGDDVILRVDFDEISFPINEQEKREADDWDILNNVKTPIDIIQERDPEISEPEAIKRFEENKAINTKYSSRQTAIREAIAKEGVEVVEPTDDNQE